MINHDASGHHVEIRRILPATREEVFAAWLDPESIRHWMCPGDVLSAEAQIDARVGGKYRILMKSERQVHDHSGEYQVIESPSKLVFTWTTGESGQPTLVTIELFERGAQTELVLRHERFVAGDEAGRYERGWGTIVEKLAAYFAKSKPSQKAAHTPGA